MSKDISMSPIVLVIGGNHERAHKSQCHSSASILVQELKSHPMLLET